MKYLLTPLLLVNLAIAQPIKEKIRIYEHENKGCPINSLCSKSNGELMLEWERVLELSNPKAQKKSVSEFIKNNGLPVIFLSKKSLKEKHDVILSASRCRIHNPKNPYNALYKGIIFSKSIPTIDGMLTDEVHVFDDKNVKTYRVAHEAIPLFIKDQKLHFLEDFEDNFYQTSVDSKGNIQLVDLPQRLYGQAQSKKIKEIACPEQKKDKKDFYNSTYCQKIWNIDTNKMQTIQVYWSCP